MTCFGPLPWSRYSRAIRQPEIKDFKVLVDIIRNSTMNIKMNARFRQNDIPGSDCCGVLMVTL